MSSASVVGIIGGSSLISSKVFEDCKEYEHATPFGSVRYKKTNLNDMFEVIFIQRHDTSFENSYQPPHSVNHKGIWYTFKHLNVNFVFGICSVGSLKPDIKVGSIVLPDDYFCPWDILCMNTDKTAHHTPVIHNNVKSMLATALQQSNVAFIDEAVYVQTKGPRFETKAEIRFMSDYADIVGMTGAHEATLSAECNIPYAMLCVVDNMANGISNELTLESFFAAQRRNKAMVEACLECILNYLKDHTAIEQINPRPNHPKLGDFDLVIHAKYVVLVDEKDTVINDGAVGVKDGLVIKIGKSQAADSTWNVQGALVVRRPEGILMPGLINAHTHASMVYLRGSADDLRMTKWLTEKIWPAEGACVSEQMVADSTLLAIAEMIKGGTTCFNDMYFFPEAVTRTVESVGMRCFSGAIVVEFPSPYGSGPREYLEKGRKMIESYANRERCHFCVAPHSAYAVSEEHLIEAHELAKSHNIPLHIHMHETKQEILDSVEGNATQFRHNSVHKCRPLTNFKRLGIIDESLIAVHMTQVNDEEIQAFAENGAHVVHCPASNLKLASGFCPVAKLVKAGVNVALGTDGAASNNSLDMFREMRLASLLAKGIAGNAEAIPARTALKMATINGARALGIDKKLGSIEIVYACDRDNVTDVWIQGRCMLENRRLCTMDVESVKERIGRYYEVIREALNH